MCIITLVWSALSTSTPPLLGGGGTERRSILLWFLRSGPVWSKAPCIPAGTWEMRKYRPPSPMMAGEVCTSTNFAFPMFRQERKRTFST